MKEYKNTSIKISGSKNSSLPIIAASILCDETVILHNIPNISDVFLLIEILNDIGIKTSFNNNTLIIYPSIITKKRFLNKKINKLRGSYYLIGALIGKTKYANFSFLYPGGCKLGVRPINYHLNAFSNMGLTIKTKHNRVIIKGYKSSITHNLIYPSVGATINIILSSCKINSKTIINNASIEPEVIDVCNFLISMGANIIINNRTITIIGNNHFHKTEYTIMEDRIEAGTFLILGAIHNGITIENVHAKNISYLTEVLSNCGYKINIYSNKISLLPHNKGNIKPFNITLSPHPGFPTDLGPLMCVLASQINGTSYILETVFKDRFNHINELKKMNIDISLNNNLITINGSNTVLNSIIKASDLRCAASLLLSATMNHNYTIIEDIDYLFRGYENIKEKLNSLGIEFII